LAKPAWTPPGWVFGPAWTLLYMLMALAAWQVWRRRSAMDVRMPLALFAIQLALNLAWTPIFFGMRRPGLALVEIVLMLAVILATTASFVRVSRTAALLMLPYCAWVCFATALNWAIWRMN
jgi:tryptophan-rich sensory protein